jgi:hypothetical protein
MEELTQEEIIALKELIKDKIPVEKEESYDKQELLEEAKRRYIAGTQFKSLLDDNKINTSDGNFIICNENTVIITEACVCYLHGRWAEIVKEEPKKESLFVFEGNEYFEGDKIFWFIKSSYKVYNRNAVILQAGPDDSNSSSKIYPTKALCLQGLHDYIWENHKVTAKEFTDMWGNWINNCNDSWKHNYCQTIINQKNG